MIDYKSTKNIVNAVLDYSSFIEEAKKDKRAYSWLLVVGTIIVFALCVGIMYLRFRVFGG